MHQIQRYILKVLTYQAVTRFSELRPPKVEGNLFSYHLKSLIREGLVVKCEGGYTLAPAGLRFVDTVSLEKFEPRRQPKIMTLLVLTQGDRVLMVERGKQPFIGLLSLPGGKVHLDDASLQTAAERELGEKLPGVDSLLRQWSHGYLRAHSGAELVSAALVHVFRGEVSSCDTGNFISIADLDETTCAPGIKTLLEKVMSEERDFFEIDASV